MTLSVTTVSGDPTDILADSTLWIRDSGGDHKDYPSKVRVKDVIITSVSITLEIAENNIDWANGDIVYAKRLFEIWPRIPYIDPNSGEQFKDPAWAEIGARVRTTNESDLRLSGDFRRY